MTSLPLLTSQHHQIRWLAELTALAANRADTRQLLIRVTDILRDAFDATRVVVGPSRFHDGKWEAHDDAGPSLAPDTLFAIEAATDVAWWRALTPYQDQHAVHGLAMPLAGGGLLAWYTPSAHDVNVDDADFMRSLAYLAATALERRAAEADRRNEVRRIVRAKQQWQAVVDALGEAILVLDKSGNVLRVNRTIETWGLGRTDRTPTQPLSELLQPFEPNHAAAIHSDLLRLRAGEVREYEAEYPLLARRLRLSLRRINDGDGHGVPFAAVVIENLKCQSEDEEAFNALAQGLEHSIQHHAVESSEVRLEPSSHEDLGPLASEPRFSLLIEHALCGMALVREGKIVLCNARFAEIFGAGRAELVGLPSNALVHSDYHALTDWHGASRATGDHVVASTAIRARSLDGRVLHVASSMAQVDTPEGSTVIWSVLDSTRERLAEEALQRSRTELQVLSVELIKAQETERQRVAAELHDGIGQSLSAIKFTIRAQLDADQACRGCAVLTHSVERIQDAIDEVRRIAMDLRPSMLDDLGLLPTVDWFCREFAMAHPALVIARDIRVDEEDVPRRLRIVVFRLLQEAMRNVVDHAQASRVKISLYRDARNLRFNVADNGIGFTAQPGLATARHGLGLDSMRERAEQSGGTLRVESVPGTGTTVAASWLLPYGHDT